MLHNLDTDTVIKLDGHRLMNNPKSKKLLLHARGSCYKHNARIFSAYF
jgi:hypothetical protein